MQQSHLAMPFPILLPLCNEDECCLSQVITFPCVSLYTDSSWLLVQWAKFKGVVYGGAEGCEEQGRGLEESGSLWVICEEGLALTGTELLPHLQSRGSTNVRKTQGMNTL